MTDDDGLHWLPLPEAATRLGKSTDAIRSMVRRDKIAIKKGNNGGVLVGVTVKDGQATADDQATDGLGDEVEHWRRLAEIRAIELATLTERLAGLEAVSAARIAAVEADVAARDVVIAKLEELLAKLYRPFWRRFF